MAGAGMAGAAHPMGPAATTGSIGTPFQPWGALDDALLDPPVRPLVRALNATAWVRTVFSCGGHPEEADSVARGRRQAHVDVVTCDLRRWQVYVQECRQRMPVRVYVARPSGAGTLHLTPRVREASLGQVPDWLR